MAVNAALVRSMVANCTRGDEKYPPPDPDPQYRLYIEPRTGVYRSLLMSFEMVCGQPSRFITPLVRRLLPNSSADVAQRSPSRRNSVPLAMSMDVCAW